MNEGEGINLSGIFKNWDNRKTWTLTIFLYVGLGGLALQVRGPLMSNIQSTFSISKTLLGVIAPTATLGFAAAALVSGMFAGKINVRKALLFGVGSATIMSILVGLAPVYFIFLGFMIIRGIASGVPGGLCRPLLGHLYPESRGKIYNLNEAIWAIGATTGPIFASFVLMFGTWRLVYILLGFLFLPVVFLLSLT